MGEPHESRPRSALGQALVLHQDAVQHCEDLFAALHGEVTDETEDAEARRDLTGRQALEALAQYSRYLDERDARVAVEREALDRFQADTARRREWCEGQIRALAEQLDPGRTKLLVGTRTVKLRRSTAVETTEELDLREVPAAWLREKPERVIPASRELDRSAAGADLRKGWREGEPPCDGWYEIEGHGRLWLFRCDEGPYAGQWCTSGGPGAALGFPLTDEGLSVDPAPGLDVLRWRPSPPGVRLVHRVYVRVE